MSIKFEDRTCHCEDMTSQIIEMRGSLNLILSELKSLKRERLPASPEDIESLLKEIYNLFGSEEWPVIWVMEQSIDDDDSMCLRKAISKCLNEKLTIRRLSLFLTRIVGQHGSLMLKSCGRSREGKIFKIVTR